MTKMRKRKWSITQIVAMSCCMAFMISTTVFAAEDGTTVIQEGFDLIYGIIAAIVSSIGSLLLLWGLFEWGTALNTQDGGAQSAAFKRVASGVITVLVPQLLPLIMNRLRG